MQLHVQLWRMVEFPWLNKGKSTLNFSPEASGEIKCVRIISDGELSGISGGASEKADFIFGVEGDAVSEAG